MSDPSVAFPSRPGRRQHPPRHDRGVNSGTDEETDPAPDRHRPGLHGGTFRRMSELLLPGTPCRSPEVKGTPTSPRRSSRCPPARLSDKAEARVLPKHSMYGHRVIDKGSEGEPAPTPAPAKMERAVAAGRR